MIARRIVRRRMLVRGAVVAGGAYAAGKAVQRGRDQDAAHAEPATPPGQITDETVAQLEQLAELKEKGILTDDEFAEQKARILGG